MLIYKNKTYKIVVVTPAGRKKYMNILLSYILKQKNIIDEYRIWVNTTNLEDLNWFKELNTQYKDFVTLEYLPEGIIPSKNCTIHNFFANTIDKNTIYIRLDDDIVWLENDFAENLVKFRIDNPKFFIIFGNIINNAVIDHIHQKQGIPYSQHIENNCLSKTGWKSSTICEEKHINFIKNLKKDNIKQYKFDKYKAKNHQRISINAICWFGKDFKEFSGIVGNDEEVWLSETAPRQKDKKTCVCGSALCVHFAFWTQREYMDKTNILQIYEEISKK